jgi:hypothetical protein
MTGAGLEAARWITSGGFQTPYGFLNKNILLPMCQNRLKSFKTMVLELKACER